MVSVRDWRKRREWKEGLPIYLEFTNSVPSRAAFVQPADVDAVASEMFGKEGRTWEGNIKGREEGRGRREGAR